MLAFWLLVLLPFGSPSFLSFGRSWKRPVNARSVYLDYEGKHQIVPSTEQPTSQLSVSCIGLSLLLSHPSQLSSIELTCQLLLISLPQEVPLLLPIIPLGGVALTGVPGTLASSDHLRLSVSPTMSMCQTLNVCIC